MKPAKKQKSDSGPRPFDVEVGSRIRARRKAGNLSVREIAEAVDVNQGTISRYENGLTPCSAEMLVKIAGVLKCKAAVFLDGIKVKDGR